MRFGGGGCDPDDSGASVIVIDWSLQIGERGGEENALRIDFFEYRNWSCLSGSVQRRHVVR